MKQLPESFLDQMKELLKDEYDDFVRSYEEKPVSSLRINTSKISVRDFLNINPFHLTPIPWTSDGIYYSEDDDPSRHPYYPAGLYYIQEASAMLPGETLPVEENDIILDACAAPGGKSLKLADKLNDTGVLFSNDVSVSRCQVLLKNLESHGVKNAIVMAEDLKDLDRFEGFFDKILVDAPCSGEGMFRKEPDLIKNWLKYGNEHYAEMQKDILARGSGSEFAAMLADIFRGYNDEAAGPGYVAMYDAASARDINRVLDLQQLIMQISTTIYTVGKHGSSYLKGLKCALSLLGIINDDFVASPFYKFEAPEREKIRQALDALPINNGKLII